MITWQLSFPDAPAQTISSEMRPDPTFFIVQQFLSEKIWRIEINSPPKFDLQTFEHFLFVWQFLLDKNLTCNICCLSEETCWKKNVTNENAKLQDMLRSPDFLGANLLYKKVKDIILL